MSVERAALAKVTKRIIPFLFILYVVAYLDRVNVSFAALEMKQDLGFSDAVYGFGAGIFFLGYFLFEIPSNLVMDKVGARIWIARIMILWGVLAAGMAFVRSEQAFYIMRFLLGVGEAGFFPGMILYLTYWYPAKERAKAVSLFMTATAISNAVGGPVSTFIMKMHGFGGMRGWEWLFILEGVPACLLGFVVLFYMTDRPQKATWLTTEEKDALIARLEQERLARESAGHHPSLKALLDPKVAILALIYFCIVTGSYGVSMWMPLIVKQLVPKSDNQIIWVGLITAIPYSLAAIAMVFNGYHSDHTRERRWHVAVPAFMAGTGLVLSTLTQDPILKMAALSLGQIGLSSYLGPFWALPTAFLGGTAAAGGIALINSVGNLGGLAGPAMVGAVKTQLHTESFTIPLLVLAVTIAIGGILVLTLKKDGGLEHHEEAPAAEPVAA